MINIIHNTVIREENKDSLENDRKGSFELLQGAEGKSLKDLTKTHATYFFSISFDLNSDEEGYIQRVLRDKLDMILSKALKKAFEKWLKDMSVDYKVNDFDELDPLSFSRENKETWLMSVMVSPNAYDNKRIAKIVMIPHANFLTSTVVSAALDHLKDNIKDSINSFDNTKVVPVKEAQEDIQIETGTNLETEYEIKPEAEFKTETQKDTMVNENAEVIPLDIFNDSEQLGQVINIEKNTDPQPYEKNEDDLFIQNNEENEDFGSAIKIDLDLKNELNDEDDTYIDESTQLFSEKKEIFGSEFSFEDVGVNTVFTLDEKDEDNNEKSFNNSNEEDPFADLKDDNVDNKYVKGNDYEEDIYDTFNNSDEDDSFDDLFDEEDDMDMFEDLENSEEKDSEKKLEEVKSVPENEVGNYPEKTAEMSAEQVSSMELPNNEKGNIAINDNLNHKRNAPLSFEMLDALIENAEPLSDVDVTDAGSILKNDNFSLDTSEEDYEKEVREEVKEDSYVIVEEDSSIVVKEDTPLMRINNVPATDNGAAVEEILKTDKISQSAENVSVKNAFTENTATESEDSESNTENNIINDTKDEYYVPLKELSQDFDDFKGNEIISHKQDVNSTNEISKDYKENICKEDAEEININIEERTIASKEDENTKQNLKNSTVFTHDEITKKSEYNNLSLDELKEFWDIENPEMMCEIPTFFDSVNLITDKKTVSDIISDIMYYQTQMNKSSFLRSQTDNYPKKTFFADTMRRLEDKYPTFPSVDRDFIESILLNNFYGYNVLSDIINSEDVSDIKVLSYDKINAKIKGDHYTVENISFASESDYNLFILALIERHSADKTESIIKFTDTEYNEDYILRFNITLPEINSCDGAYLHIRKVPKKKTEMTDLIKYGMLPVEVAAWLVEQAKKAKGIVFSGPSASGKTTLMNALLEYVDKKKSVLAIQESEELFSYTLPNAMFQHITKRYDLDAIGINGLLCDAGYFIIGEIKGKEARTFIRSANTGHMCWCSVHSSSAKASLPRLADYVKYGSDYSFSDALKMLVDLEILIYIENFQVKQIDRVCGFDIDKNDLIYETIYRCN